MDALPLIVFDANETLLDLTTLEPTFERIFRDKGAMRFWFANLILYSSALTDDHAVLLRHQKPGWAVFPEWTIDRHRDACGRNPAARACDA